MNLRKVSTKIKALILVSVLFKAPIFGQPAQQNSFPATSEKLAASAKLAALGRAPLKVAFVLTNGAVMIDFAGPWEVFQDVMIPHQGGTIHDPGVKHPFELYTVSDTKNPVRASGGMQIIPDYSFDDAPEANIVVIPAQMGSSAKMMDWIRKMAQKSDLVFSVCTGASTLAETGLLNGKTVTTHHDAWGELHRQFPNVTVKPDMRYVQSGPNIFTSGGLSSGIDLALHIVDLYFGRKVAENTAYTMEYEGAGWKGNGSSTVKYQDGMEAMHMRDGSSSMK